MTNKPPKPLYFIALMPPKPVQQEIMGFKTQALRLFGSGHALKSPPHITLQMPFRRKESHEHDMERLLAEFAWQNTTFTVTLNGFNRFDQRVIYVHVEPSEALHNLQYRLSQVLKTNLNLYSSTHKNHGFTPHITVAFRDLKKSVFPQAWQHFSQLPYSATFTGQTLALLKHNGHLWQVHQQFTLSPA